jgi:threonylcarbamoyladenosine tRNA methylthiotransferase MtaB
MKEVVPMKKRNERSKMLRILSEQKWRKFCTENLGQTFTVLFEEDLENGKIHGFTENYTRLTVNYDPMQLKEFKLLTLDQITIQGDVEALEPDFVFE